MTAKRVGRGSHTGSSPHGWKRRRWFSVRPALTLRGRTFKGLRGWAGKPFHPPLTDVPVAAFVLVAVFDLVSILADSRDAYVAGTWTLFVGAVVSPATALTGFWDWWRSTPRYTQAWRTANWHMAVMGTVVLVAVADLVWRMVRYDDAAASGGIVALSVVAGAFTFLGATYGGSLTFDYGFNVETSGDHPVWHESEEDVYPDEPHHPSA